MHRGNLARYVTETPWAILPTAFAPIADLAMQAARGVDVAARAGVLPVRQPTVEMQRTVAMLPLFGVLVPRDDLLSRLLGCTPLDRWQATFEAAVNGGDVDAILLCVDSPGGSTELVAETAAIIREARGTKPIVAIANTCAASAAYWIACQADELVVTPSGRVGSIGVFAAHTDISVMQEMDGIKTTLVSAGKFKTEGNPFEPLSDEARAAIQTRVDEAYAMFVADVAAGRGVSQDAVRKGYGEGRIVPAHSALEAKMVDRIDSLEATVARLLEGAVTPRGVGARVVSVAAPKSLRAVEQSRSTREAAVGEFARLEHQRFLLGEAEWGRMRRFL
jgi:signal peptide peptidase SppA